MFTSKQHGPIKILDFVIFAECWRFVSGDQNKNIWVQIIVKSCTYVLQRCGRNWAIFRMDQFESSGDWDEYVLMNMWRSPNVPTSHLSNCPAATLPLVNFALFFLFLTKHYIYMFSSSSIFICTTTCGVILCSDCIHKILGPNIACSGHWTQVHVGPK